ncbi:MAG: tautomerase family protein [Alphaproteobacteria bacterium]|nr:tautomerase family protein [Alphaproteobacteria bacterium]
MAQVKIYGEREHLTTTRQQLSDTIHGCLMDAIALPQDKRFQRFIALAREDFIHPADRSGAYTIIEISMFEGRTPEAKRRLLTLLMERIPKEVGISAQDLEITLFETPKANWGIRGSTGDQLALNYKVSV